MSAPVCSAVDTVGASGACRLGDRRAVVSFAGEQHGRRLHVAHQRQRRTAPVFLGFFPGLRAEPVAIEEIVHVRREHEARPVDHRLGDHGGAEAIRLADDPRREHAAARTAGDEQVVGVDVALRDHRIDAGHQVVVVIARIGVVDQVAEGFAVAGAAARVGVQHDVARRREQLQLGGVVRAVGGERPAVDLEDQRIFLRLVEIGRRDHPALDVTLVLRATSS